MSGRKNNSPGILNIIPGYKGYKAKESRRDEDKQARLALAREYDLIAQRLTDAQGELVRAQQFAAISNVERLERSLRRFTDRLRTATYGYGGLFSERSIDEHALDQIAAFDHALGDGVDKLGQSVEDLVAAATKGADLSEATRATQEQIDALNRRFDLRTEAINSGNLVEDEPMFPNLKPEKQADRAGEIFPPPPAPTQQAGSTAPQQPATNPTTTTPTSSAETEAEVDAEMAARQAKQQSGQQ